MSYTTNAPGNSYGCAASASCWRWRLLSPHEVAGAGMRRRRRRARLPGRLRAVRALRPPPPANVRTSRPISPIASSGAPSSAAYRSLRRRARPPGVGHAPLPPQALCAARRRSKVLWAGDDDARSMVGGQADDVLVRVPQARRPRPAARGRGARHHAGAVRVSSRRRVPGVVHDHESIRTHFGNSTFARAASGSSSRVVLLANGTREYVSEPSLANATARTRRRWATRRRRCPAAAEKALRAA